MTTHNPAEPYLWANVRLVKVAQQRPATCSSAFLLRMSCTCSTETLEFVLLRSCIRLNAVFPFANFPCTQSPELNRQQKQAHTSSPHHHPSSQEFWSVYNRLGIHKVISHLPDTKLTAPRSQLRTQILELISPPLPRHSRLCSSNRQSSPPERYRQC